MARNAFDEIKQMIHDQTKAPAGLVSNLHGTVAEVPLGEGAAQRQEWFALTIEYPGQHPTYRQFVDTHSYQRLPHAEVAGVDGRVSYPSAGLIRATGAVMLFTAMNTAGPQTIPVTVSAPGHTVSVYRDGLSVASDTGTLQVDVSVSAGTHFLAVICSGGTNPVAVGVPTSVALFRQEPTPDAPILVGGLQSRYLKAGNGSYVVDVSWYNDASASAWQVYRARSDKHGVILDATDLGTGEQQVRVLGQVEGIAHGEEFFTQKFYGGVVESVAYQQDEEGRETMLFVILRAPDAPAGASQWIGRNYYRPSEAYQPVARLAYSGQQVLTFPDATVQQGYAYHYRVTAFGFITGLAESDFSSPEWVIVKDDSPPGNITFDSARDIQIVNGELILDFRAPFDDDYAGVQVFLEDYDGNDVLLTSEPGLVGEQDRLTVRLPRTGTYRFKSYDTSGNVQPTGVTWVWDGTVTEWNGAVEVTPVVTLHSNGTTFEVSLIVGGPAALFPAKLRVFLDTPTTPLTLADGLTEVTLVRPGTFSPLVLPGLASLTLGAGRTVYAEITDTDGLVSYGVARTDADSEPGGTVIVEDYRAFPVLSFLFDEDVEEIRISIPKDDGSLLGTVGLTRGSGLPLVGGGTTNYVLGSEVVSSNGALLGEDPIAADQTRGIYTVSFLRSGTPTIIWSGRLNGPSSFVPSLEFGYQVDQTVVGVVDITVKVSSPAGEDCTIQFKDEDDLALPIWTMVESNNDPTFKYVASGASIFPAEYFYGVGIFKQALNNVPLVEGQVKRVAIRAVTRSGITSPWMLVTLPFKEIPVVASVDLVFDQAASLLHLHGTAGLHTKSARFEIADNENFFPLAKVVDVSLTVGQKFSTTYPITGADRNKRWFGRVTGYNGAFNTNTNSVTGLGGVGQRDAEFVPNLDQLEIPSGTVALSINDAGVVTLHAGALGNALSFLYDTSKTAIPTVQTGQIVNFNGQPTVSTTVTPTLSVGERLFVTAWFFAGANGTGAVGLPQTASIIYVPAAPPSMHSVLQTRVSGEPNLRLDVQVRFLDPLNRGGTVYVWTNPESTATPDPNASPPQGILTVGATPITVTPGMVPALGNIRGNGNADKHIFVEFVNIHGQTTGKQRIKLDANALDLRITAAQLTVNQLDELSSQMGIQVNAKLVGYQSGYFLNLNAGKPAGNMTKNGVLDPDPDNNWFIRSNQLSVDKNGNAYFSGNITVGAMQSALNGQTLSTLNQNLGIVYAGQINNNMAGDALAFLDLRTTPQGGWIIYTKAFKVHQNGDAYLSGMYGGFWHDSNTNWGDANETYIDFRSGSSLLFKHRSFQLYTNGDAYFRGDISLETDNAVTKLRFNENGTEFGNLRAYVKPPQTILGFFTLPERWTVSLQMAGKDAFMAMKYKSGDRVVSYVSGGAILLHLADDSDGASFLRLSRGTTSGVFESWNISIDATVNLGTLIFNYGGIGDRYRFDKNGNAYADSGWFTFSPKPPKPHAIMSAKEWLDWGAEDAKKPVKPYDGLPSPDHPEVKKAAKGKGKKEREIIEEDVKKYGKDISKIAIGTANWAVKVQEALEQASDFEEFKQLLGA